MSNDRNKAQAEILALYDKHGHKAPEFVWHATVESASAAIFSATGTRPTEAETYRRPDGTVSCFPYENYCFMVESSETTLA